MKKESKKILPATGRKTKKSLSPEEEMDIKYMRAALAAAMLSLSLQNPLLPAVRSTPHFLGHNVQFLYKLYKSSLI